MPGFDESTQCLVDGLFSQDHSIRVSSIKRIKNAVIGNKTKKSSFMLLGVIPRLVSLIGDDDSSTELVCEAVITLGSFAHGTPENIQALLSAKALPVLVKGTCLENEAVVSVCVRTLRTLYRTNRAPPDVIFSDITVVKKLISLVSSSNLIGQCAAIILAKACQNPDQQNLLCAHGVVETLAECVLSNVAKILQAALQCLSSVVYENKSTAQLVTEASFNNHSLVVMVTKVLSSSHSNEIKLAAAKCLSYLCRAGGIHGDSAIITLKVLPALVRLCKKDLDMEVRADAVGTLAYLTQMNPDLQQLAADSDHLISSLVVYLSKRPDENDDLVLERHFEVFECLCESVFLTLASLAMNREEIRIKIVSERNMLKALSAALNGDNVDVKVAAVRCLHSLSRSTKLLRTNLADFVLWKPCLSMMSLRDEECLVVSTGVMCNFLLNFSPSREKLVEGGALDVLATLTSHDNPNIQLNAVWAFMSAAYQCSNEIRQLIVKVFTYERLFSLLSPSTPHQLLMKTLGLFVNLVQNKDESNSLMSNHGNAVVVAMVTLFQANPTNEIVEQLMCVLVNVAESSSQSGEVLLQCHELLQCVVSVMQQCANRTGIPVLLSSCKLIKSLADTTHKDYTLRQNRLEECGIKLALQKLECKENWTLQQHAKTALDQFNSHSL